MSGFLARKNIGFLAILVAYFVFSGLSASTHSRISEFLDERFSFQDSQHLNIVLLGTSVLFLVFRILSSHIAFQDSQLHTFSFQDFSWFSIIFREEMDDVTPEEDIEILGSSEDVPAVFSDGRFAKYVEESVERDPEGVREDIPGCCREGIPECAREGIRDGAREGVREGVRRRFESRDRGSIESEIDDDVLPGRVLFPPSSSDGEILPDGVRDSRSDIFSGVKIMFYWMG